MASRRKKVARTVPFNATDIAAISKANPYIQRLIEDAKLRGNVRTAYDSSRSAYDRMLASKAPHRSLLEDSKLHRDLRDAAEALRDVTVALTLVPKQQARKRRRFGRKLLFVMIISMAAVLGSETLRSKLLDTLFGAEEEFQYTPPVREPTLASDSPVAAA